jgi:N-acetylneuraminic acid mutarotase
MLATAAGCAGRFFLVGGTDLHAGTDGKPARTYLTDGYQFTPDQGWKMISDLPQASVAAPSPALADDHGFVVLGGDDGALINFEPKTKHPGFPRAAFAYEVKTGAWTQIADMPVANVTNPATQWFGSTVVVSGEARPGVRSPAVWSVQRKNDAP